MFFNIGGVVVGLSECHCSERSSAKDAEDCAVNEADFHTISHFVAACFTLPPSVRGLQMFKKNVYYEKL